MDYLCENASQPLAPEDMACLRDTASGFGCQLLAHPNRQHASPLSDLASRLTAETLATRFDRLVLANLRLIWAARCSVAISRVSGFNWANASSLGLSGLSSGSGRAGCAASGDATSSGGTIVGWLVSSSIFSGHLRSDLIRMAAVAMISGRSAKLDGELEKLQLAINSRAASALPTDIKYLVTGTPITPANREIQLHPTSHFREKSAAPRRCLPAKRTPRRSSLSPFPRRLLPARAGSLGSCTTPCRSRVRGP
jgi:hypothetical protein